MKEVPLETTQRVAAHAGSVNRNYDNTDDALIEGVATHADGVNRNTARKDLPATNGWVFSCVAAVWNKGGSVAAGNRRQWSTKNVSRRRSKDSPSFMWGRNCHTFQVAQMCESHKIKV